MAIQININEKSELKFEPDTLPLLEKKKRFSQKRAQTLGEFICFCIVIHIVTQ